jgi:hypothetical protein
MASGAAHREQRGLAGAAHGGAAGRAALGGAVTTRGRGRGAVASIPAERRR